MTEKVLVIPNGIDRLIERFPFSKVMAVMELLDWKWGTNRPTLDGLRQRARILLVEAMEPNVIESSTGGFVARYWIDEGIQPMLQLRFVSVAKRWRSRQAQAHVAEVQQN